MENMSQNEERIASSSFVQILFDQLHARQKELGYTNETLMQVTEIAKSTFYRIWRDRKVDVHMDIYYIEKLCEALQMRLSAQPHTPAAKIEVSEAAQAEVAANTADLLIKRKEAIEEQAREIENLSGQLTEKQQTENEYLNKITELHDEIRALHKDYNRRIEELQKELNHRQDQMCELFLKFAGK